MAVGQGFAGAAAWRRRSRQNLASLLLAGAAVACLASAGAMAQVPAASRATARQSYDIPRQPLDGALAAFSRVAGVQVLNRGAVTHGVMSPGVNGSFTREEALSRLLGGTGLTPRFVGANTVTVSAPVAMPGGYATEGAIALDTIDVQGTQSPVGEGAGFVARNSLTGSKTATPLTEIPQTVSITTRAQIDAQQATNLTQAARYVPGVYFGDNTDTRNEYFKARGFTLDQYQDGMKLLTQGAWIENKIDPFFLSRIEVLEGPSSALYGQSSPGGLVNLASKRPTETPFGHLQLQTGSYGRIQGAFDFGGPLAQDGTLLYRLTGLARHTGTQVDDMKEQRVAIAPALTWKPNADTSLTILASYLNDPKGGFWSSLPYLGTLLYNPALPGGRIPRSLNTGQPNFEKFTRERASIGYEFEHRFDNVFTFRQNARYSHVDTTYNALQAYMFNAGTASLQRDTYMYRGWADTVSVDNQLQAKFSTGPLEHNALVGLDYQYVRRHDFSRYGAGPNLNLLAPNYAMAIPLPGVNLNRDQTFEQLGVYAQDQIKFNRFVLTLSGRGDRAWSDSFNRLNGVTTKQDDRAFTGRVGLTYLFENGIAPYASYSTSFNPSTGSTFNGDAFKPTTGEQYEVGVKYQPVGWDALFTLAAFDLTQQNVLTSDPYHTGFQVQTGEIRARGITASAAANLTEELKLQASYTYLDPEVTKDNSGLVGKDPANVPRNLAKLWLDYTFRTGPLAGLGLGAGVRYTGVSFANTTNTYKIPDYALFDVALRYDLAKADPRLKGWAVSANVANLFDRIYVSDCSNINCRWGQGRTIYGTVDYRW